MTRNGLQRTRGVSASENIASLSRPATGIGGLTGTLSLPLTVYEADYELLYNQPQIEGVTLKGNKTFKELGLEECSQAEILALFSEV